MFTTNYDLLLYWSVLRNNLVPKFTDGFAKIDDRLYWAGERQELFWLHGGLHLYWEDYANFPSYTEVVKLKKGYGSNLVEQIKDKLSVGRFPIAIAEGDWKSKAKKISKNPYLKDALLELLNNNRPVITFGIGFEQDDHILSAIKNSPCNKLIVGVYDPDITKLSSLIAKLAPLSAKGKEIFFYKSETVTAW